MAYTVAQQRTHTRIGPQHDGRRMSFARFQRADSIPGYLYELAGGVIEVTDVSGRIPARVQHEIEKQLYAYEHANAGVIEHMATAAFAKTEMPEMESERHPDFSVCLTPMPDDEYPWDKWVPTIAIEIVSPGRKARVRDYQTKRREYLAAGILEYWIIDPQSRRTTALTRHGDQWREHALRESGKWVTPLLPGFVLDAKPIFAVIDKLGAK